MAHRDNWHVGDFNLFWSDIRDNVHDRVDAAAEELSWFTFDMHLRQ